MNPLPDIPSTLIQELTVMAFRTRRVTPVLERVRYVYRLTKAGNLGDIARAELHQKFIQHHVGVDGLA